MENYEGKQLLSIVIPCYNEASCISETISQLVVLCCAIPSLETELIFVDDGSQDETLTILRHASLLDPQIKVLALSRNFGHQIAVSAGIDAAKGDAIILIDADLQDPPELIHQMLTKWREGYQVVYGVRKDREGETPFKKISASVFYRILNSLSDIPIPLDTGDFRLISREVAQYLKDMPERDRFLRGMVSWIGFNQCAIPYQRHQRFAGESKYPLRKMVSFAINGIVSFSIKPLQISMLLGFFSASISLIGICYAILMRLLTDTWVEGWTTLLIAVLFLGGVQLISIGLLGSYVGRIYGEVKQRPLYIIAESLGFSVPKRTTTTNKKKKQKKEVETC